MDVMLVVITLGSFVISVVHAAFATGGIYIMLAAGITAWLISNLGFMIYCR